MKIIGRCSLFKNNYLILNYKKIYKYIKPFKWQALLTVILSLPIGAMDAMIAWALRPFMDAVMLEKNPEAMTFIPIMIVGFSTFQSILTFFSVYMNAWVGNKITMGLKRDLFKKLIHSDPTFFDQRSSGDIQMRFNNDADMACNGLLTNIKNFTTRLFSSFSLLFVLFYNSWQLAIIALVAVGAALYPLTKVRKRIKEIMKQTIFSGARVMTHYNEAFAGNRIIASYNLHKQQADQFDITLDSVFKLGIKMVKRTGSITPVMHFIISLGVAGVIWFGGYLITSGQITPGTLASFITALIMLYQPIKGIGDSYAKTQNAIIAMERVFNLLDSSPRIVNKPNAAMLETVKSEITYNNVQFYYTKDRPVLKGVSVTFKKGQTVALVGNSGGGKTTFVNLLPRFYDVKSGNIKIDGIDIRDYDLYSLREKISIVFQDNVLFSGTIRQNILLGKENATEEEINQAIKGACLDEFIDTLPAGLDTEIGERGILLSGGQRQRVAIARAFIKDAPIVILDEATSALDNKSEQIVQYAIYNLMKGRTVFIIAHRLSTVMDADTIVVIQEGNIVEKGTHTELLQNEDSVYASLYKTQLT